MVAWGDKGQTSAIIVTDITLKWYTSFSAIDNAPQREGICYIFLPSIMPFTFQFYTAGHAD